jgi:hypothetical protein
MIPTISTNRQIPHWIWVLPILLLANALIAHHLTTDVFWFDELANLRKMGVPPYPSATLLEMINNVGVTKWPPAYNFVLLAWGNLVGWSEIATRTLSLLMGVLSIAMMYRLGIAFHSRRVGMISILLLSTSVFFIFYAHEVRGYIQYLFLTITVLFLYWRQSHQTRLHWTDNILFLVATIMLIYTHYVALYIVFAIGVYHLLFAPRINQWGKQLRGLMFVGIAYLPWVAIAVLNAIGETIKDRGLDPITIIETLLHGFSNGLWFILLILILYSLVFVRNRATMMLVFCATLFLSATLITNVLTDFLFHIRHIIGLLPILLLLSSIAIDHLLNRTRGLAWLLVIIWMGAGIGLNRDLVFMDNLPGALENRPLEIMTTTQDITNNCANDKDFVITHLASQQHIWNMYVEQYYLWQPDFTLAMIDRMVDFSDGFDNVNSDGTYESRLQEFVTNAEQTWVFVADDAYSTPRLDELGVSLAQEYAYCDRIYQGSGVNVYLYQQKSDFTCQSNLISTPTLTTCALNLLNDAIHSQ